MVFKTSFMEDKVKVGDLVRLREGVYRNFLAGEYLIYMGDGSWVGWGRFTDTKGQTGQVQLTDLEVVLCK